MTSVYTQGEPLPLLYVLLIAESERSLEFSWSGQWPYTAHPEPLAESSVSDYELHSLFFCISRVNLRRCNSSASSTIICMSCLRVSPHTGDGHSASFHIMAETHIDTWFHSHFLFRYYQLPCKACVELHCATCYLSQKLLLQVLLVTLLFPIAKGMDCCLIPAFPPTSSCDFTCPDNLM